jgi:hypothetical protein
MAYSKWFILPIFGIYIFRYLNNYEKNENLKSELIIDDSVLKNDKIVHSNSDYIIHLFLLLFCWFFVNSQLFVQLTIYFLSPDHALMESVVLQIVFGIIGIFILVSLIFSNLNLFCFTFNNNNNNNKIQ